jgi:hypothetical protein
MSYSKQWLKKKKFHEKTLSANAIYNIYLRTLDASPIFAQYVWLQISAFDLTELGMGLLYSILPVDYRPLSIDFTYVAPQPNETLQGIWAKFEPVDFAKLYNWMADFRTYVIENFKEEYQPEVLIGTLPKAIYGVTPYGRGVYDPVIAREFLRSTFWKLRLIRTPDISWQKMMDDIAEYLEMIGVTDEHIYNRLMMIFSAQTYAFVLGLSVLGRSRLTETVEGWGVVPIRTAKGEIYDLYFKTLDQLQMGLILGVTPLGYGLLLPEQTIYKMPEDKKNPAIIKVMVQKIKGIISRITLSTWAYTNYHKAEEMTDYHKSMKTSQYDILQTQRSIIEDWVARQIPPEEANPIRIRQYKNAVLQAISWRAKRHFWGYEAWKIMTEEQFKSWWKSYWKKQDLNESTLETLYMRMEVWLKRLREEKVRLGEKVKETRQRLALLT